MSQLIEAESPDDKKAFRIIILLVLLTGTIGGYLLASPLLMP
jgi:hypothetical protein